MPNPALTRRIENLPGELASIQSRKDVQDVLDSTDGSRSHLDNLQSLDGAEESAPDDYRREWLGRYVYNSNAIEGSTLTLADTELILEGEFVPSDGPAHYIFAAKGIADGMDCICRWAAENRPVDIDLIRTIHGMTALDVQPVMRGVFRPYGYAARIVGAQIKTADPLEIWDDLEQLIDSTNWSEAHPILKAAAFHMLFENVHPFADGNGRTGRQLHNLMLMEAGYQPPIITHDTEHTYGRSLEQWQACSNPMPFLALLTSSIKQEQDNTVRLIEHIRYGNQLSAINTDEATLRQWE
ncbi:MAG: Fic family protein [Bifidobacterium choerinum]